MSTPSSPGWYPNPDNPDELRYFDGILWTDNTTPLRVRQHTPPQTNEGTGVGAPSAPGAPQQHQPLPGPPAPSGQHYQPSQPPQPHQMGQARQPSPTASIPGEPDLAPYGLRVVAYLVDGIIVTLVSLIFGGWFAYKAMSPVLERFESAMASGDVSAMNTALLQVDRGYFAAFIGVQLIVFLAYHVIGLTKWGATPGKLMVGISVRRIDRPGVLDRDTAIRRVGFQAVLQALGNVPLLSAFATITVIADLLWPLADRLNQSLHDKVGGTIVVRGKAQR